MINNSKMRNNKWLILVIVLLLIVVLFLTGYICYDKGIIFNNNLNGEAQSDIDSDNIDDTDSSDGVTNNEDINIGDDDNESNNITKELDLSKSLNTNGISYENHSDIEGNHGFSLVINSDKTSATLKADMDKFMPIIGSIVGYSTWEPNSIVNYPIKGFSKKIVSTFIGELGQDATGITLFFIMDDGTVEFTPLFIKKVDGQNNSYYDLNLKIDYSSDDKIIDSYFYSSGMISDVKNVVKLYNVDASNGFDWRTTIGAKNDGSFYDLGSIIQK